MTTSACTSSPRMSAAARHQRDAQRRVVHARRPSRAAGAVLYLLAAARRQPPDRCRLSAAADYGSDGGVRTTGISLGMALAVSGAAASSAMGIYSSKSRAFLLTLANARLGLWFGNPASESTWQRSEPPLGVGPLLREMLGLTTDEQPVRLPVRRRPLREPRAVRDGRRAAAASSWSRMPAATRTTPTIRSRTRVRRIRLDSRHPDRFRSASTSRAMARATATRMRRSARSATAVVDGPDAPDGTHPLPEGDAVGRRAGRRLELRERAIRRSRTTRRANQFFDEARFESYRSLGFHTVKALAGRGFRGEGGVQGFCEAVRATLTAGTRLSPSPKPVPPPGTLPTLGGAGQAEWSA